LVLQLPIGSEGDFIGVVDLVGMRALVWRGETAIGEDYEVEEIPADLADAAQEAREALIETLADADDDIAHAYLEGDDISVEDLKAGIRRATLAAKLNPVLCGTAFKNKGVQPLLDAVIDFLPSPIDVGAVKGHSAKDESVEDFREPSESEPFAGVQTVREHFVGFRDLLGAFFCGNRLRCGFEMFVKVSITRHSGALRDFRRFAERETGVELDAFFDNWLYRRGKPVWPLDG
jgi:translation elongation factor EF-G